MSMPTQIVPDVWLLRNEDGQWNCGIIHNERDVLLVDPGPLGAELGMLESFLEDTGRKPVAVVQTHLHGAPLDPGKWPGVPRLTPGTATVGVKVPFLPGWQVMLMPGEVRLGVYSPDERILFLRRPPHRPPFSSAHPRPRGGRGELPRSPGNHRENG